MPERRDARRFEPPPWEADQFAALERARLEEERRFAEQATQAREAAATQQEPPGATPTIGQAVAAAVVQQAQVAAPADDVAVVAGSGSPESGTAKLNDAALEAMIAQLSAEEPRTERHMWTASLVFAVMLVVIGGVMALWGGAAIASAGKGGSLGSTGGIALSSLGSLFVGAGGWVIFSNLRKRGVL